LFALPPELGGRRTRRVRLWRQEAGTNICAANGPKGEGQDWPEYFPPPPPTQEKRAAARWPFFLRCRLSWAEGFDCVGRMPKRTFAKRMARRAKARIGLSPAQAGSRSEHSRSEWPEGRRPGSASVLPPPPPTPRNGCNLLFHRMFWHLSIIYGTRSAEPAGSP
jgi:hypothetical protein